MGAGLHCVSQKLFGDKQNKKDDNPNEKFHYIDGLIQIPDEMYNINEKYQPNNSGLSDYNGPQASHEGHLKWQSYNCWVLSNLYLYFRPELKSTYEEYAGKPIKDIIYALDNLPGNESCTISDAYVFFKGMPEFLNKLKDFIQNRNTQEAYELLGKEKYIDKGYWRKFSEKHKLDLLTSYYNYRTIYRFHYALSIKNRCRIYVKMINNPNKMVNVYQMDDFCKESDALPSSYLLSDKDYYIKSDKVLCRYFSNYKLSTIQEYSDDKDGNGHGRISCPLGLYDTFENSKVKTFGFDWKYEGKDRIWSLYVKKLDKMVTNLKESKDKNGNRIYTDEQINDIVKYGKNTKNGKVYRLVAMDIHTNEWNGHGCVIRLKYDDNLKCSKIVHKDCYRADDKIVDVTDKENLFKFIFNPSTNWVFNNYSPRIEVLHFITEDELRNNLEYYKA